MSADCGTSDHDLRMCAHDTHFHHIRGRCHAAACSTLIFHSPDIACCVTMSFSSNCECSQWRLCMRSCASRGCLLQQSVHRWGTHCQAWQQDPSITEQHLCLLPSVLICFTVVMSWGPTHTVKHIKKHSMTCQVDTIL